ncbi:MAG: hypothetical protein R6U32_06505 [Candidatus Woesearchaeota archaeon]
MSMVNRFFERVDGVMGHLEQRYRRLRLEWFSRKPIEVEENDIIDMYSNIYNGIENYSELKSRGEGKKDGAASIGGDLADLLESDDGLRELCREGINKLRDIQGGSAETYQNEAQIMKENITQAWETVEFQAGCYAIKKLQQQGVIEIGSKDADYNPERVAAIFPELMENYSSKFRFYNIRKNTEEKLRDECILQ